jgi:HK97 family phage portal protein
MQPTRNWSARQGSDVDFDPVARSSVPWFQDDDAVMAFAAALPSNTRANGFTEEEEYLLSSNYGATTASGITMSAEAALRVSTAFACRRVISEDIAKLPMRVVRREFDPLSGRTRTTIQRDHAMHALVTQSPCDFMTAFEFWEYLVGVATFHEGSYALIQRDPNSGRIVEMLPLLPGTVHVERDTYWNPTYRVSGYGDTFEFDASQILRLHGPMADPWQGHSVIGLAREAVALAASIERAQSRFHANDMRPSGIVTAPAKLGKEVRELIRDAWTSAYGPNGTGGVAVLDEGFKFETIMAEGAKAEVIENRKFQVSDTCRFFRVFPTAIGHNDGSQSFASVESFFTAHASHTLHPWVVRLEQAATASLLSEQERAAGFSIDIDMSALTRGTFSDRVKSYQSAVTVYLTPNEIREAEGYDRIDDPVMDRVQLPANNTGMGQGGRAPIPGDPAAAQPKLPPPPSGVQVVS